MLAWLHQMTPTERENAQSLLKGCDKSGNNLKMHLHLTQYLDWILYNIYFQDVTELVRNALSNITEGVCRPLRIRLEQVISPDIGPAVLHTLSGLIRFYLNTIGEVLIANLITLFYSD